MARATIGAVAGVFLSLAAGDARATLSQLVTDNMETNVFNWTAYDSSGMSESVMMAGPAANARSPINYGFMTMTGSPSDWSSFGRYVNMSVITPSNPQRCFAQIYVRAYQGAAHGQLEVIDAATWTYVSIAPFDISSTTYQLVSTQLFALFKPNIFVRVVLIGNNKPQGAFIDDLSVACVH